MTPLRILYAEDEADIRSIVQMALEVLGGYAVLACDSGEAALQAAPTAAADLLLLDMMMPGMDGLRTLEALRQLPATAHTPVVFMTAKVQAAEIAHFKARGALDVISKPFDPMTLAQRIQDIWEAHRACGATP